MKASDEVLWDIADMAFSFVEGNCLSGGSIWKREFVEVLNNEEANKNELGKRSLISILLYSLC